MEEFNLNVAISHCPDSVRNFIMQLVVENVRLRLSLVFSRNELSVCDSNALQAFFDGFRNDGVSDPLQKRDNDSSLRLIYTILSEHGIDNPEAFLAIVSEVEQNRGNKEAVPKR